MSDDSPVSPPSRRPDYVRLLGSWLVVGIPLAWGIWETLKKSLALFGH